MKLKKDTSIYEVQNSRSFYLFLNRNLICSADDLSCLDIAKYHVLNTLCICGIRYDKSISLYEDEEGIMHEVHEITTI